MVPVTRREPLLVEIGEYGLLKSNPKVGGGVNASVYDSAGANDDLDNNVARGL